MNKLNQLSQLQLRGWQLHSIGAHSKFNQSDSLSWKLNNGKGTNQIATYADLECYTRNDKQCINYRRACDDYDNDNYSVTVNGKYTDAQLVKYSDIKWSYKTHSYNVYYSGDGPTTGFKVTFSYLGDYKGINNLPQSTSGKPYDNYKIGTCKNNTEFEDFFITNVSSNQTKFTLYSGFESGNLSKFSDDDLTIPKGQTMSPKTYFGDDHVLATADVYIVFNMTPTPY